MAQQTLPPDYFREAAKSYSSNRDRKTWLKEQIALADRSLLAYQAEINKLAVEYYKLSGKSTDLVTIAGGVLAAIPTGYTQVIGGIVMVAGSFFSKMENKQKLSVIEANKEVGLKLYQEALAVAEYKTAYERELQGLKLIPFVLAAVLIWIIIK